MFYIQKNNKIILADTDYSKLKNTLIFLPTCQESDIQEAVLEKGFDGKWYLLGNAPQKTPQKIAEEEIERLEKLQTPQLIREAIKDILEGNKNSKAINKLQEIDSLVAVQQQKIKL